MLSGEQNSAADHMVVIKRTPKANSLRSLMLDNSLRNIDQPITGQPGAIAPIEIIEIIEIIFVHQSDLLYYGAFDQQSASGNIRHILFKVVLPFVQFSMRPQHPLGKPKKSSCPQPVSP